MNASLQNISRNAFPRSASLSKERQVEFIINEFRFLIVLLLALLDVLAIFFKQIQLVASLSHYRALIGFVVLLPFMVGLHLAIKSGKYRSWIKYATSTIDLMIVFLIALPVVMVEEPQILLTKLEFTLIISFLIVFVNSLSLLKISKSTVIYSGILALILNALLYWAQGEFVMVGLYTSIFLLILSTFNVWITNFMGDYFVTSQKLSDAYDDLKNAHEQIQHKNAELTKKSHQIENQVNSLEDVHKDLTDSLLYAQKIQVALINHEEVVAPHVRDHFVMFKPREHVSGDFYWAAWTGSKLVMTVADCTGHGVPGAFMTMLGSSFLNEIVNKEGITEPDQILNRLRDAIIGALHQKGTLYETRDGMDMAIVQIDTGKGMLKYAGANNSLCYIPNHQHEQEPRIYEFKGDRMPISFHYKMHPFSILETTYNEGDRFYLYTDGYIDQFGGPKGKKFKLVPFKRMLLEHHQKPMQKQKQILEQTMQEWLSDKYQQIDDITVLGFQV